MDLCIPRISGDPLTISVDVGQQLYVVGANGAGKSALFQHWATCSGNAKFERIHAHRQTWFESGNLDFTARSRKDFEVRVSSWDRQVDARWIEHGAAGRQSAVLFDLVAKENERAREITRLIDCGKIGKAEEFAGTSESPFDQLNALLALGNLNISLSNSKDEEVLAQHYNNGTSFNIAQMSDGERAAAIMAAKVLTVGPGTTLLIDEPERHLHRSIIEPFLSALFTVRQDCAFLISTHEIALPIANPESSVVILRSCQWNGDQASAWNAEVLQSGSELPEDLKRDVLGARRRILFVEGESNSLDLPLYGALFPELSVIPKGSCEEVVRAVKGLRGSCGHHYVEAFGLIDRDDRTEDEVNKLAQDGIFALEVYSVESLYYCSDAIEAVAHGQAKSLGQDPQAMLEKAKRNALEAIATDQDLPSRMAVRRSEKLLCSRFETHLPYWKVIKASGEQLRICESIENPFHGELSRFKDLVNAGDIDGLIARYPLRESRVLEGITTGLRCRNQGDYARMVVARVREDAGLTETLKARIKPLAELIDREASNDT